MSVLKSEDSATSNFPATTVKVIKVEPCNRGKVCIIHRLAETGSAMLSTAVRR